MTDLSRLRQQAILRHAAGYIELGELLVETDKPVPAAAQTLLLRALATLGELPDSSRSMPAAQILAGEALRALGRWQDALQPLSEVVERAPQRLEAWLGLGWCLKRLGRLPEATDALRRGLESSPQQAILHYNLACYLSLAGNSQSAIEHLAQAINLDSRYRELTEAEPDFNPIRSDPRFIAATHVTV
ncbi:MAG: tetratricopeptide repeat protein [Planctomycetota bacterium]|nr:MAG: tetratricopeptide repeat protein [Planctomycetota bacterium]